MKHTTGSFTILKSPTFPEVPRDWFLIFQARLSTAWFVVAQIKILFRAYTSGNVAPIVFPGWIKHLDCLDPGSGALPDSNAETSPTIVDLLATIIYSGEKNNLECCECD